MSSPHLLLLSSPVIGDSRFMVPLADALTKARQSVTWTGLGDGSNAELIDDIRMVIERSAHRFRTIVIAYSGAGPMLPGAIARAARPTAGAIFMDATLPHPGRSRLDELRGALPGSEFGRFEAHLRSGGSWPAWTDADLAPLVADASERARLLSLITPRPAAFFDEVLPPDDLPPDLPCGYLRLSRAYDAALAAAEARTWPTRSLSLTHFAPFTHPAEVAEALIGLVETAVG